jgi:hypothetical protein
MNVGMMAIIIATLLILLRTVDERKAIKGMPWGVILMVTGVTVLIALLEKTEGLDLFTSGIARVSTPSTIAPIVAFGTGVVSVYSSTGGVVLPAFLPMVPELAHAWADPAAADRMVHERRFEPGRPVVALDVGALFMAGAAAGTDTRRLFNSLFAWGCRCRSSAPCCAGSSSASGRHARRRKEGTRRFGSPCLGLSRASRRPMCRAWQARRNDRQDHGSRCSRPLQRIDSIPTPRS